MAEKTNKQCRNPTPPPLSDLQENVQPNAPKKSLKRKNQNNVNDEPISKQSEKKFCCGEEYVYSLPNISCRQDEECRIQHGEEFYQVVIESGSKKEVISICPKHYEELEEIIQVKKNKSIAKNDFKLERHNKNADPEETVECTNCKNSYHLICAQISKNDKKNYECKECKKSSTNDSSVSIDDLQPTDRSTFIENYVNRLKGISYVTVREISSKDVKGEVPKEIVSLLAARGIKMVPAFPHRRIHFVASQKIENEDVIFFGCVVQEYKGHKGGWTNIAWLDSVRHFEPSKLRGDVYQRIILAYLKYAASIGYSHAHIRACAPKVNPDYLFNVHPINQRIRNQVYLQFWYNETLKKGMKTKMIKSYKNECLNIDKSSIDTILETLYFYGGFWHTNFKNILKRKEINQSKNNKDFENNFEKAVKAMYFEWKDTVFYIELAKIKEKINAEEKNIVSQLADSRDNWLKTQFEYNWEFGTLRRAKYSTRMIIKTLVEEQSVQKKKNRKQKKELMN